MKTESTLLGKELAGEITVQGNGAYDEFPFSVLAQWPAVVEPVP